MMLFSRNPVSALETGFLGTHGETRFPKQKPGFTSARSRLRPGFTLLEILLASLIAILLMAALYFAMDMTLRQTQESRDGVEVDNLSRGVYTRMSLDFSASLGPLPPKSGGNSAGATPSTPTTPTDPTIMSTTTPPTTTATTQPATTTTDPAAAAATPAVDPTTGEAVVVPQAADVGFQAGIVGTDKQLTVFASRLPSAFTHRAAGAGQPSDLVRITYWISQNGGLCRQERPWVTADGVRNSTDPDTSGEDGDTLVQEVSDVTFEYFDGSSWLPSWDGSAPSPDGVTPTGPPRAVKVTLSYSMPSTRKGDPPYEHTVVQVIPVRAAPGSFTPEMITPSTDMGTTSSDPATSAGTSSNMNTTGSGTTPTQNSTGTTTPAGGTGTKTGGGTAPAGGGNTKSGGGTAPASGGTKTGGGR